MFLRRFLESVVVVVLDRLREGEESEGEGCAEVVVSRSFSFCLEKSLLLDVDVERILDVNRLKRPLLEPSCCEADGSSEEGRGGGVSVLLPIIILASVNDL